MTKINLEIHDNAVSAINKIKGVDDLGVELLIPEGCLLFENILNLKLIEKYCEEHKVSVQFTTEDVVGNNLISMLNGKGGSETFISEVPVEEDLSTQIENIETGKLKRKLRLPQIKLPIINFKRGSYFIYAIPALLILGYVYAGTRLPKATAKISVHSQPLTRSITIKVKTGAKTSMDQKLLKGTTLNTTIDGFLEVDTTGEKLVGEKAEGEITVYNKTDTEIELSDGEELAYKEKSTDLVYYLKDSVTVPARAPQDPLDPASPLIPGEATVFVEAADIGESYNIDSGWNLEFENYKKNDIEGKTKEDIDGGKSETVKTVSEEDKTNLSAKLLDENTTSAEESLKKQLSSTQKIVTGSTQSSTSNESFSHEVDDETEKLSLTQSVYSEGLSYSEKELDNLLDDLVEELIPEGFILSKKDREVSVEVLGNTATSILSSTETDIQVTLKAHVVPNIAEDSIKEDLKGKSMGEAQKILGSIKNVKNYELNVVPTIPFFRQIPGSLNRISIEIETN